MNDVRPRRNETEETMAGVVRLLDAATRSAYDKGDARGCGSSWHMLAWGLQVATAQALELIPPDVDIAGDGPTETEPLRLIHAALELAATLAIAQRPYGLSALLAALQDLAVEAHAHEQL